MADLTPPPTSVSLTFKINVTRVPNPSATTIQILVNVFPAIPSFTQVTKEVITQLTISPIPLPFESSALAALETLLDGKVDSYFDQTRYPHTLLNFGNDYQALITNWMYDPADSTGNTILVKLYRTLPDDVTTQTPLWIVTELAPPVVDRVWTKFLPPPPPKIYLRPPNRDIRVTGISGAGTGNQTWTTLFSSSSQDIIRPTDPALEGWFTEDINSVELNVDYSDYRNFVFYGSAQSRLDAFVNKLLFLENYDSIIANNSASLVGSGSSVTGSAHYPAIQAIAEQRIDLIRSFDPYERFLYYKTDIPYSASVNTDDAQDEILFNTDATWPKISGSIAPVASASFWYGNQSIIASEFDKQNVNSLANNIPQYLFNDQDSQEFIQFLKLVGHQMDFLKIYVDAMTDIYNRDSDPNVGISPDLVWNIGQGFGINLPNQYAIKTIVDYTIGNNATQKQYRLAAAETWKRFLHNQIFMMKAKGTKTALRALANAYGILPTLLQIRESGTPGIAYPTQSFENIEEQTFALALPSSSWIEIPWFASSSVSSSTVEVRFSTTDTSGPSVLLHAGNTWALQCYPTSGTYGFVALTSPSTIRVSSSILPIYSGDFFSTMLRYNSAGIQLQVKQADEDDIINPSITQESSLGPWNSANILFIGSSGSFTGHGFKGIIDEFRMWNEVLTDATFDLHVKYPGLYNGNTTTSARDNLTVRLSFNKPQSLGAASVTYLPNEAPSFRSGSFRAVNFPSMSVYPWNMDIITRNIVRYGPNAGGNQFTTNKIIIADPPVLKYQNGIPVLDPKNSIVSLDQKKYYPKPGNTIGYYFSLAEAINDSMIRTFGNIDLQDLIGDPLDQYNMTYGALQQLAELYWNDYAYNFNANLFIDFVENLLSSLFEQAKLLVPARAKLITGIVHEPNILERSKVIVTSPPEVTAGYLTRRHQETTFNLQAQPLLPLPTSSAEDDTFDALYNLDQLIVPTGVDETYDASYNLDQIYNTDAELDDYDALIDITEILVPTTDIDNLDSVIPQFEDNFTIDAESLLLDDKTNLIGFEQNLLFQFGVSDIGGLTPSQLAVFNSRIGAFKSALTIDINNDYLIPSTQAVQTLSQSAIVQTIFPFTNFDNIESYLYFTQGGLLRLPKIIFVRSNQSVLNERGVWSSNVTYARNDYVEISSGKEFYCITTNINFISITSPDIDTVNWKPMQYIPTVVPDIHVAVIISGSVTVVPSGSTLPPAIEYRPQHFVFSRDYRQGIIRHQYLGCLQTIDTTVDGKPPVETFNAPGGGLFVTNAGEPIPPPNNPAGPILDVR